MIVYRILAPLSQFSPENRRDFSPQPQLAVAVALRAAARKSITAVISDNRINNRAVGARVFDPPER